MNNKRQKVRTQTKNERYESSSDEIADETKGQKPVQREGKDKKKHDKGTITAGQSSETYLEGTDVVPNVDSQIKTSGDPPPLPIIIEGISAEERCRSSSIE
jgi:hypothetical protein